MQCDTHVRDSDTVTLREKVTRRRIARSLWTDGARLALPSVPPRRAVARARPAGAALAGCGGQIGADRPNADATLLLDFTPNAVHAGIYIAMARGFDDAEGVSLTVRAPGASTDALALLQAGRADLAILDIHDLGLARQQGRDLVGVMALVQRPLAAVLAQPECARPRDSRAAAPASRACRPTRRCCARSCAARAATRDRVRETTIGFEAVRALLAGRVAGATAFWNVEGVALQRRRPGFREFRVDEYGAPRVSGARPVRDAPDAGRAPAASCGPRSGRCSAATARPRSTRRAPSRRMLRRECGASTATTLAAQLDAVAPAWTAGARTFGELQPGGAAPWAAWDLRFGILERPLDVARAFDTTLVAPQREPVSGHDGRPTTNRLPAAARRHTVTSPTGGGPWRS